MKARYLGPLLLLFGIGLMLMPFNLPGKIPYFDKVSHMMLFMLLTFVILRIIPVWKTVTLLILLGISTELAQIIIPNRSPELFDAVANITGVLVAYFVINIQKRFRRYGTPIQDVA